MSTLVDRILSEHAVIPNDMVQAVHIQIVLENIEKVLVDNIPGDIVEFGCNEGTTSLFISRFLKAMGSDKGFHVYDSFLGLPDKRPEDGNSQNYLKGYCKAPRLKFEKNFYGAGLPLPDIHEGWFQDIKDNNIPKSISFAFLDGDFYSSIMDSLVKVYPRLVSHARVIVHDYEYIHLPGVAKACTDFLKGKPESIVDSGCGGLGLFIKE